ncbi:hyaluronidase-4-like isoform X4 [Brienomyrus brachyistius]|uniref:hyaluronidase-4-like isoform X4 n=1 Tax=Brienomyrus brachyistius TaxID=42636 RepID=UPI0020B41A82|nr:hyaluronidase-4-like isoform X4 [Brienomyrus brachyistius]
MHWGLVSGTFHQPIPAASSLTCIWLICLIPPSFPAKPAQLPLIGRKPFVAAWNAPLDVCTTRYNVSIDLKIFHMHGSPRAVKTGQDVTIFYANRLGYYPFYTEQGTPVNGGLPQNCSLESHLRKASQDIRHYIPSGDFSGLAVIDWEYWRPQWSRNWHLKDIYRRKSRELIQGTYVNVTEAEVEELARHGFEDSATAFMRETLQLGTLTRPLGLWGFYLYPDCHNYHLHERNYTGSCPLLESIRNDELLWLWNSSTALFPSVAIRRRHTDSPSNLHFSRCRVRESLRIAGLPSLDYELPVFVYTRLCYRDEPLAFLTMDLIHTIGESAALGAAGFVIWGDLKMTSSRLPEGEILRAPPAGPLHRQRDSGGGAVQPSTVQEQRPLRTEGPGGAALPAPQRCLLPHCGRRGRRLHRHGRAFAGRAQATRRALSLPLLPGIRRGSVRPAPDLGSDNRQGFACARPAPRCLRLAQWRLSHL